MESIGKFMDIRQPSRQSPVTGEVGVRAGDSQQHRAAVSLFLLG